MASEATIIWFSSSFLIDTEAKIVTWIRNVSFVKPTRCSVSHEHRIIVCPSNPSTSRKTCFSPRKEEIFQNVIPPASFRYARRRPQCATQIFHQGVLKIGHSSSLESINNEISVIYPKIMVKVFEDHLNRHLWIFVRLFRRFRFDILRKLPKRGCGQSLVDFQ